MSLLSFSFKIHQGTQRVPRNTLNSSKYTTYAHNNKKNGHSLSPRGGNWRRKILDSHPYSYETSIFTLGAPMKKCRVGKQNFTQVLPWVN